MSAALCTVDFHGHTHTLIEHAGEPHVAMKPIVEAIGLDWKAQHRRIMSHDVMGSVVVMTATTGSDGKRYEMFALPLKYLNGWLFGVDARRVKPALRDTLVAYQRECFDVLDRHWRGNRWDDPNGCPEPDAPPMPASVNHQADHITAAARVFRSLMKLGFEARLPRHRVLASANTAAIAATGYDIAAVFGLEDDLLPPPAAVTLRALPRTSTVADWLDALNRLPPAEQPRGPVLATLAHEHYASWCRDANRGPLPLTRFVHTLRVEHGVQQARKRMRDARDELTAPLSILYLGPEHGPPRGQTEARWIGECHDAFWLAVHTEPA